VALNTITPTPNPFLISMEAVTVSENLYNKSTTTILQDLF
jgi:hypothetical protein